MNFFQILTPFLFASIGGLYTEYSGTTNVALEGYMTLSAFIYITLSKITGDLYTSFILTILFTGLFSLTHALLTIKLKANPIITSLAVNMGIYGIISALSYKIFKTKGVIALSTTNNINTVLLTITALILPFITLIIMEKSRYGLRLKVRGESKKTLIYSGINPDIYRVSAIVISSILSGLGGIFLAMELRSFIPNISAGRGWISLVIIYLGRKHPLGILAGCSVFALAQIISNISQSNLIPTDLILALPYILTLIALIISSIKHSKN